MLVCHDMAGGYGDDKWVQSGDNGDAYAIWHWYLIDVFVYFSHSLVSLPPPGWVNTAHRHGVKINMEVQLDKEQIPNLKEFVSHLIEKMHAGVANSLVIWYDSVTIDGKLSWQDQLNDNNKPFFDICDGIFVNYTWKETYPKLSRLTAGDRKFDIYMGIDAFGRGSYGGGQWNTNVALEVLKQERISAAIFSPGWVYETKQPPDFQTAQNRWWSLIDKAWGIHRAYPNGLPFCINFYQGRGFHFIADGMRLSDKQWCNISLQSLQPFLTFSEDFSLSMEASVNLITRSQFAGKFTKIIVPRRVTREEDAPGWIIQESSLCMKGYTLTNINAVCYKSNPGIVQKRLDYTSERQGMASENPSGFHAVLGHIMAKAAEVNSIFPPQASWQVEGKFITLAKDSAGLRTLSL
ncbi:hypothetical protein QQ045_018534 [Rhodiola kirilowii]